MSVISHQLLIHRPRQTLDFYQRCLGMDLTDSYRDEEGTHYRLRFPDQPPQQASLELICNPERPLCIADQPSRSEGYWKITVAVPDISAARRKLMQCGIPVGEIFTVPDVATLCHLKDPEGYCIELLEYASSSQPDITFPLAGEARFLLSTYRVKDPQRSLEFYKTLGWHLISRQVISSRSMTLYFLAPFPDQAPDADPDALVNRPWLWQRSYTLLEWQHVWGTEQSSEFRYHTDSECGFYGLQLEQRQTTENNDMIIDPDGYRLTLSQAQIPTMKTGK